MLGMTRIPQIVQYVKGNSIIQLVCFVFSFISNRLLDCLIVASMFCFKVDIVSMYRVSPIFSQLRCYCVEMYCGDKFYRQFHQRMHPGKRLYIDFKIT